MDYIKNEDSGIEKYREIRPFRCPVCNSRVCDVRRWSRKDKARFSFLHSDGLDGDISLLCPKCKHHMWMSIT